MGLVSFFGKRTECGEAEEKNEPEKEKGIFEIDLKEDVPDLVKRITLKGKK